MAVATVKKSRKSILVEWSKELADLVSEMGDWAREAGWLVHETKVPIEEDSVGKYIAPGLQIKPPIGHFFVEPLGRDVLGAEGRIDLYAWPSMHRMMLIRRGAKWRLLDDNGRAWPKAWSRKTFLDVAQILTSKR
jgi:hypothetical protein